MVNAVLDHEFHAIVHRAMGTDGNNMARHDVHYLNLCNILLGTSSAQDIAMTQNSNTESHIVDDWHTASIGVNHHRFTIFHGAIAFNGSYFF